MANQADLSVRTMCRVLGVSASGFYAWRERAPSQRSIANAVMTERIRQIHQDSYESYGMPRVRAELIEQGVCISRQRVARLMRQAGIHGISKRRGFTVTTRRDKRQTPAHDLVNRRFHATGPNQLWVADMTYVPTWMGFLYLAVVIDVWSRRVVGWAMGERMTADLVLAALNMALEQRKPKGVIHHSDQGSQYTSLAFGERCRQMQVRPRWERWAMPTTTRWPRASLPAWKANSSSAAPSRAKHRPAWQSSPGLKAGTTPGAGTAVWATSHP